LKNTDRGVAVAVLTDVLDAGAFANIALRKALADTELDSRSRAFVTELVNETLRNLIQIDHGINNFSKMPVEKMKPFIRNLLRVSVCQIRFMDKIPDRAAVNEAVTMVKAHKMDNLSGFVNAILRNISREDVSKIKSPALKYSYPKWLMKKIIDWLGENSAEDFCKNSHLPPPIIILTNTHKTDKNQLMKGLQKAGIDVTPLENSPHPFLMLRQAGDISKLASFKDGLFFVIDPGAMFAIDAMEVKPGQKVIDVCAAPGGKSFAAACLMQNEGEILSFDIHQHRVELLRQTKKRLGLSIITPSVKDALVFDPTLADTADVVLLDAPCSGFGTIRKHPEIKYSRQMQDVLDLAKKQKEMLEVSAKYVKPGGRLVYSTCTIAQEENDDNLDCFLENHQDFNLIDAEQILPSATNDGFYVASFERA